MVVALGHMNEQAWGDDSVARLIRKVEPPQRQHGASEADQMWQEKRSYTLYASCARSA